MSLRSKETKLGPTVNSAGKGRTMEIVEGAVDADHYWMSQALLLAEEAASRGEVPVGAILVREGCVLGQGFNSVISGCDPTAHAEIQAMRAAARSAGNYRLPGATLYVTIEPCTMCAGALVHARISRLVFGAREPKAGAVRSRRRTLEHGELNWRVEVIEGIMADACAAVMSAFFAQRRRSARSTADSNNEGIDG